MSQTLVQSRIYVLTQDPRILKLKFPLPKNTGVFIQPMRAERIVLKSLSRSPSLVNIDHVRTQNIQIARFMYTGMYTYSSRGLET